MKTAVQTIQEAFPMMKHPLACHESLLFQTFMKHSTWALPTVQRKRCAYSSGRLFGARPAGQAWGLRVWGLGVLESAGQAGSECIGGQACRACLGAQGVGLWCLGKCRSGRE